MSITVDPVNDEPVAGDDSASTTVDTPVTTVNVLLNDTDVDGDALSIASADTTSVQGGSVVNNGDGTFTYTPPDRQRQTKHSIRAKSERSRGNRWVLSSTRLNRILYDLTP